MTTPIQQNLINSLMTPQMVEKLRKEGITEKDLFFEPSPFGQGTPFTNKVENPLSPVDRLRKDLEAKDPIYANKSVWPDQLLKETFPQALGPTQALDERIQKTANPFKLGDSIEPGVNTDRIPDPQDRSYAVNNATFDSEPNNRPKNNKDAARELLQMYLMDQLNSTPNIGIARNPLLQAKLLELKKPYVYPGKDLY